MGDGLQRGRPYARRWIIDNPVLQESQDLGAASPAADSMQRDGPRGRLWIIDGPIPQERQNLGAAAASRGGLQRDRAPPRHRHPTAA